MCFKEAADLKTKNFAILYKGKAKIMKKLVFFTIFLA